MKLIINTDGGARGNPGPSGIGVVICDAFGNIIAQHKSFIGHATNNVAEYKALVLGLKQAAFLKAGELEVRMDSELVVRQMQGKYKIKEPQLKILAAEALKLINNFRVVHFKHVPRADNKQADKLVNEAIDKALAEKI